MTKKRGTRPAERRKSMIKLNRQVESLETVIEKIEQKIKELEKR